MTGSIAIATVVSRCCALGWMMEIERQRQRQGGVAVVVAAAAAAAAAAVVAAARVSLVLDWVPCCSKAKGVVVLWDVRLANARLEPVHQTFERIVQLEMKTLPG